MKKIWGLIILLAVSLCGTLFAPNEVSAYYKDNCYAIQYTKPWVVKGDTVGTRVYSSKMLCYKDKKLKLDKKPEKTESLGRPKFSSVTSNTVEVNYCTNGRTSLCPLARERKTYKLSDYGSFAALVQAIDKDMTALGNWSDYKKVPMDKNDAKTESGSNAAGSDAGAGGDDGKVGDVTLNCANQGGAQSLGWIICPILTWAGEAAQGVYDGAVEPALSVEPKLFNDSGSSVESAWAVFRDIANIIFAIIAMLVILSQLTGVGIDNYGIKKILPKLVVTAILVNISYVLCLLAVDISNILGNGLQGIFEGLKESLTVNMNVEGIDGGGKEILTTAGSMIGLAVLVYFVKATGKFWQAPQVALMLFIAAIGVVVSIFFLFILLSAREAAIVVLIVLAPVAMVLYVLPNTKSYFDKWLKMLGGLLAVYPITGLLVGGGNYVSALLLHTGMSENFFGSLTAMIAGVLPIFFIPTVLRGSMNAIGNLGARITDFGRGTGSRLQRGAENSRAYKSLQEKAGMFANKHQFENAKKYMNGTGIRARIGRAVNGGRYGYAGMAQQMINDMEKDAKVSRLTSEAGVEAAATAITKSVDAAEVADYETLINSKTRNGEDEAALKSLMAGYATNKAAMTAITRIAGRRKDTAANFLKENMGDMSQYSPEIAQAMAKEVATGSNSANFRASSPLGFEFASAINKASYNAEDGSYAISSTDAEGNTTVSQVPSNYSDWKGQGDNVKNALEHHVTNSSELVGMKGGSLDEIASMMEAGQLDSATSARLSALANETIKNKGIGPWDSTKEGTLYRIASMGATSGVTTGSNEIKINHGGGTSTNVGTGAGADFVSE